MKRLSQAPVPPFDRQAEAERLAVQRAEAEMRSASSFFYECDCVSEHKIESEVVGCRFSWQPHRMADLFYFLVAASAYRSLLSNK